MDNSSHTKESITDQNHNYRHFSYDNSFSSGRYSTVSYKHPKHRNEQNKSSYQNLDLSHFSRECDNYGLEDKSITRHNNPEKRIHVSKVHPQQFCSDTNGVDWDNVKRKLALPHLPDAPQKINVLNSEIMD